MDYQDDLEIPDEYPEFANQLPVETSSHKISSPINSAHRFFEAFPSDYKNKTITHFRNSKQKVDPIFSKHRISEDGTKRSLKQFLNFQKSFEEERQRKLNKLKQQREREEAEECRNIPAINSHSRRLTSHMESTCYQRLSKQKTFQQTTTEPEFHPKILNRSKSMRRKQNVSDLLYDDAQRRVEKHQLSQKQLLTVKPKINANTDRLVIRTLQTQFEALLKNVKDITPKVALSIIAVDQGAINQKRQKILQCLFKTNKEVINKKRLWTFIQISTGMKQTSSVFSEKQQKQILKQFKHFLYRNRMTKQRQKTYGEQPTFRPQILKNSERLAKRKREKMVLHAEGLLEKQNVKLNVSDSYQIPIADLYILQRMHNQEENKIKKENGENKQFQKCTFKPQLNKWSGMKNADIQPMTTKSSRARESFNKKSYQNHQNYQNTLMLTAYTLDSIQFQREERKRSGSQSTMNKSFREVKNLQSTIFRMSAGRKQKQYLNQCQQRGYPKDIQNWEKFRQGQKKILQTTHRQMKGYDCTTPSNKAKSNGFIFDIYINNGVLQTIHLDKSDDIINKVEELALKYNLNEEKKLKLVKMIRTHLCAYLEKDKQNSMIL